MLTSCVTSSMWLTLSDTQFLHWQNGNVNIRVLVVKMKWDNVYKALRQTCLSYSIDKLLLDVVIIKLTGALLIKSILNSKRGSFKLWSSLRSCNVCKVGISFCVEIRCWHGEFSVSPVGFIFTFWRELNYEIYLFVMVWPAKRVISGKSFLS